MNNHLLAGIDRARVHKAGRPKVNQLKLNPTIALTLIVMRVK